MIVHDSCASVVSYSEFLSTVQYSLALFATAASVLPLVEIINSSYKRKPNIFHNRLSKTFQFIYVVAEMGMIFFAAKSIIDVFYCVWNNESSKYYFSDMMFITSLMFLIYLAAMAVGFFHIMWTDKVSIVEKYSQKVGDDTLDGKMPSDEYWESQNIE